MEVEYRNKSIEKVCTIASVAEKKYGRRMAEKIQLRIDQIRASENVEQMIQFGMGGTPISRRQELQQQRIMHATHAWVCGLLISYLLISHQKTPTKGEYI